MNIKENINNAIKKLNEKKIEEPILTSKILLSFFLGVSKEYLIINQEEKLKEEIEQKYKIAIDKIIKGYPIQYITQKQEFMKSNFYVNENVLIPRADTEILVEEVIKYATTINKEKINILDLCTGSGAIGISLAKHIPNAFITMSDISKEALEVAKINAKNNNVETKIIHSNMFEKIQGKFDIIVSNPPYIETEEIKKLNINVQNEPIIALDGGIDGLDYYRKIAIQASDYLKKDGYLFLEIGYNQKESVTNIIENTKMYKNIECIRDISGNNRVIKAIVI